jgi:hypothetical protein
MRAERDSYTCWLAALGLAGAVGCKEERDEACGRL